MLSTVTHITDELYELTFVDEATPLQPTGAHRLFSLTRNDWVATRDLKVGERLQTDSGNVVL